MLVAVLFSVVVAGSSTASGSAIVTVTATVPSASWVDAAACGSGNPRMFAIGTVLPGASKVATTDCAVKFGASNDTAMLRAYQQDGAGTAMYLAGSLTSTLDNTFDTDGKALWNFTADDDSATSSILLPDGDVVLGGSCWSAGQSNFCAARVNPNGSLDTSFSGDGLATWDILGGDDSVTSVQQLPSGDFMLTGYCHNGTDQDYCAARVNEDGTFDTSFSGDGKANWDISANYDFGRTSVVLGDGDVLLSGRCGSFLARDFCSIRINADGTLDNSFDTDGINSWDLSGATDDPQASTLLADGDVILSGTCDDGGGGGDFCAVRINTSDGSLDNGFDTDGKASWNITGAWDSLYSSLLLVDGDLLLGGRCNNDYCAARVNTANGSLDTAFDSDGKNSWDITGNMDTVNTSTQLLDQDILLAGACDNGGGDDFCAARINTDGSLDTTFDTDGVANWNLYGTSNAAYSVQLLGNGTPLLIGGCRSAGNWQFCAAQLDTPAGTAVDNYLNNGTADWDTAGSIDLFGACLRSVANGASGGGSGWSVDGNGDCTADDSDPWSAIPAAAPGTKIAAMNAPDAQGGGTDPTANIRFGFRAKADQAPGVYLAPIVFETVAPDV